MKVLLEALAYGFKCLGKAVAKVAKKVIFGGKDKAVEFAKGPMKEAAKGLAAKYKTIFAEWILITLFEKGSEYTMQKVYDAKKEMGETPTADDYDDLFETPVEKVFKWRKKFEAV